MATYESVLAMMLGYFLNAYLEKNPRGIVAGEGGMLRILPTKMRIPDVSFISSSHFPGGKLPKERVYRIAPDLAVEIISEGNTDAEMQLKLREYFEAGVRMVWYIDSRSRTAQLFSGAEKCTTIDENGFLEANDVLPGFRLPLGELFERADRAASPN
jgi:Uma2 family endonuclease